MSNDILIDDSSAMAGNLVAAVDSIAKAVSESSSTFNASFDNLAKEFSGSISKVTDSVKSMHNDLLRAIDKVNVNVSVTKNIRQSSTKSKDKSDDKSIMLELQAEQLNAVRQKYAEEQSIMAELRAEQIKFISDKKNEEKIIMAELAAEQAKAISEKMIEEKTIMAELFAEQKKMADEKWLEEKAMMNELLKEEKDAIKRKEQEEKLIRQQLADEERKSIAQAGFTSFAASAFPDELAAMGKSSKGKVSASDTGWLQSLSDFSKSFEKIPLSNFERPKAEDIYPVKEMQQASSALLEGTSSFFSVMKKVDSFSILPEQPPRPTEGFEKPIQSEFTTYGVQGEQPPLKSRRKISRDMLSQLAFGEEVTPFVGPKNITEDQRNAIAASKAVPGSQVGPMPQGGFSPMNIGLAVQQMGQALNNFPKMFNAAMGNVFGKGQLGQGATKAFGMAGNAMGRAGAGIAGIGGAGAATAVGGAVVAPFLASIGGASAIMSSFNTIMSTSNTIMQQFGGMISKVSPALVKQFELVSNDLQAVIGRAMIPAFNEMIKAQRTLADIMVPTAKATSGLYEAFAKTYRILIETFMPLYSTIVQVVTPIFKWFADLMNKILEILKPVVDAFNAIFVALSGVIETLYMFSPLRLLVVGIVKVFDWFITGSRFVFGSFISGMGRIIEFMSNIPGLGGLAETGKKLQAMGKQTFSGKASTGQKTDGASVGAAIREAQTVSIESLGDEIRKSAITSQVPTLEEEQRNYLKDIASNTEKEKFKTAFIEALRQSGLMKETDKSPYSSMYDSEESYMAAVGFGMMDLSSGGSTY